MNQTSVSIAPPSLWLDQVGAGLSFACALHCILTPVVGATLPLLGLSFLASEMTEIVLLSFAMILAIGSLCWGFRLHKSSRVFLPLGAAVGVIVTGRLFAEDTAEIVLVVAGAVLLATSHRLNWLLCRTCLDCNHPEHRGLR